MKFDNPESKVNLWVNFCTDLSVMKITAVESENYAAPVDYIMSTTAPLQGVDEYLVCLEYGDRSA